MGKVDSTDHHIGVAVAVGRRGLARNTTPYRRFSDTLSEKDS
jgi:hypothetical protein